MFEYLDGGAEDEVTLRRNRDVFDDIAFVPRTLVRSGSWTRRLRSSIDQRRFRLRLPRWGFAVCSRREGDLSLARATAAAGIPFIQSTVSNTSIEDIAAVPDLRHWMQLYVFRSRPFMERLVSRALASNCEALVITTDGIGVSAIENGTGATTDRNRSDVAQQARYAASSQVDERRPSARHSSIPEPARGPARRTSRILRLQPRGRGVRLTRISIGIASAGCARSGPGSSSSKECCQSTMPSSPEMRG